eukprot:CAMPEP_0197191680 /NCGR_PEP_ID=MMETSP1423-20130617/23790_1 /TAXON_ID=476441 /ORGANISM="Pseudo-nitzschia heimii, Strain UNC1101" /LENGTH=221 /DNA_ID=CAMNT_0042644379 /DNA_START=56 /DNA_END=718 /DNA_ORIENTATION=+
MTETETAAMIVADGNGGEASVGFDIDENDYSVPSESAARRSAFSHYRKSSQFIELVLCFVFPCIALSLQLVEPHLRPIPHQILDDGTIIRDLLYDNPETAETVSATWLIFLAIPVPILAQVALSVLLTRRTSDSDRVEMIHKTLCVYLAGIGLTMTLTNLAKSYVGYLRPIFYDLCEPSDDYGECTNESDIYPGTPADREGRVSFPSGHASLGICSTLLFS